MRYLKPHFYDKFVCTAGACPDTCCAGWQIMIDEESLWTAMERTRVSLEHDYVIPLTGKRNAFTRMTAAARF